MYKYYYDGMWFYKNNINYYNNDITKVAEFNGLNAYMETITSNDYINKLNITIEAWVKAFNRDDSIMHPIGHFPNNVISNDIPFYGGHGFGLNKWISNGGGCEIFGEIHGESTPYVNYSNYNNEWVFISTTYESGILKIYVNGQLFYTNTYTQEIIDSANTVRIGKHNDDTLYGTNRFFKGRIADVRIWNKVLTQTEIQNSMSHFLSGTETGLTAYYKYDSSINNFKNFVNGGINLNNYNVTFVEDEIYKDGWKYGNIKYYDNLQP